MATQLPQLGTSNRSWWCGKPALVATFLALAFAMSFDLGCSGGTTYCGFPSPVQGWSEPSVVSSDLGVLVVRRPNDSTFPFHSKLQRFGPKGWKNIEAEIEEIPSGPHADNPWEGVPALLAVRPSSPLRPGSQYRVRHRPAIGPDVPHAALHVQDLSHHKFFSVQARGPRAPLKPTLDVSEPRLSRGEGGLARRAHARIVVPRDWEDVATSRFWVDGQPFGRARALSRGRSSSVELATPCLGANASWLQPGTHQVRAEVWVPGTELTEFTPTKTVTLQACGDAEVAFFDVRARLDTLLGLMFVAVSVVGGAALFALPLFVLGGASERLRIMATLRHRNRVRRRAPKRASEQEETSDAPPSAEGPRDDRDQKG